MAMNTLKCNHLTPLGLKGLDLQKSSVDWTLYWVHNTLPAFIEPKLGGGLWERGCLPPSRPDRQKHKTR